MALRRVYVDSVDGGEALVRGAAARHLAKVARLRVGEAVEVSDQKRAYSAETASCSPAEVRFRVVGALPDPASPPCLDAALAIVKFQRFEWAVEKLAELGVRSVTPVVAARSDDRLVSGTPSRLERWRRIAFEAAQQARRLAAPSVHVPTALDRFLLAEREGARLLAQPGGPPVATRYRGGAATLLVGPEGGWTGEEHRSAVEQGFEPVGLGGTVLRSETAAVALAAVCACGTGNGETG